MASTTTSNNRTHVIEFVYMGMSLLGSFLILRWALNRMDPNKSAKEKAKDRKKQLAKRLGRVINLDGAYEDVIAQEVVNPNQIDVTLTDVGGLDDIIDDLRRNIITPMRHQGHFTTTLLRQKRGVLLYGPPGTGKTMLAKALARECGACFINLKASTVLSKWYGDTNKLIHAVWTLAYKIQPTILFIDEVDSLLGTRKSMEHEATTAMKTEFMQLWEGFETMPNNNVVVLGATNKRDALDDAVLRRFSLQYEVRLPKAAQRESILRLMIKRHASEVGALLVEPSLLADALGESQLTAATNGANGTAPSLPTRARPLRDIAERTEGYSGSDLSELCSQAAALPVHGYIAALEEWQKKRPAASSSSSGDGSSAPKLEPLSKVHIEEVLAHMVPPSRAAQAAQRRRRGPAGSGNGVLFPEQDVDAMAAAIASAMRNGLRAPFSEYPLDNSGDEGY